MAVKYNRVSDESLVYKHTQKKVKQTNKQKMKIQTHL